MSEKETMRVLLRSSNTDKQKIMEMKQVKGGISADTHSAEPF